MSRQTPPSRNDAAQPQSMDDILAQIRQLVSDETSAQAGPAPTRPSEQTHSVPGSGDLQGSGRTGELGSPAVPSESVPTFPATSEAPAKPVPAGDPPTNLDPRAGGEVASDPAAGSGADIKRFEQNFQSSSKGQGEAFGDARAELPTPGPELDRTPIPTVTPPPQSPPPSPQSSAASALDRLRTSLAPTEPKPASAGAEPGPAKTETAPAATPLASRPEASPAPAPVTEQPAKNDTAAPNARLQERIAAEVTPLPVAAPVSPAQKSPKADLDKPTADAGKADNQARASGSLSAAHPALEALVADALKPMLRKWLDANLERVVNKAVAEELARRRKGGDDRS